ncbi:hypothetical protein BCV70DRAFT_156738 [Testicularia cyperi]|uniref:Small ribosomal subunit protein mS38 n=1 Tax=Testicularia cyperi TaxID=1882483 RepID=A0A317XUE2_9BASI|nr:hypothetical protein BCV70DRAFT_156738 [Testicularia cyperi]
MRGRSIHARAILRLAGSSRSATPSPAPIARGFLSTCGSRSARASTRNASSAVISSSSSSSSKSPNNSDSSASSAPSNGDGASSSSGSSSGNAPSSGTSTVSQKASSAAVRLSQLQALQKKSATRGVTPANPPPSTLPNVAWESFFANDRPLLQHDMLPPRSKQGSLSRSAFQAIFTSDGNLAAFGKFSGESPQRWRRRMRGIEPERFDELIDGLAGLQQAEGAEVDAAEDATQWLVSSFQPESDRVAVESAKLEEEERLREEREEAILNAEERGEDTEAARKLGAEADLVILGEPNGPSPKWSRGVATYLAEKGRAYEAPPAPRPASEAGAKEAIDLEADLAAAQAAGSSEMLAFEDTNLLLSHAMVQQTLPLALKWDKLVAQMDAAALNDPTKASATIDLSQLNANLHTTSDGEHVSLDSVRRKRRKKIRKHKYKKLRKSQRAERQRMKK